MKAIHSAVLHTGITSVSLPDGAEILDVGFDPSYRAPAVYYLHHSNLPAAPFIKRTFLVVCTYEVFDEKHEPLYLGSCIAPGDMRLHFMEIING